MKKKLLFILFLGLNSFLYAQTTEEEYLYATFGYKEQLLKGLDDKKGYTWKPITEFKFTDESGSLAWKKSLESKFEFEGLYREGENVPCAIVTIYKKNEHFKKMNGDFICIPHPNSGQDILSKSKIYFEQEINLEKSTLSHYSLALSKLAMTLAQGKQMK